MAPFGRRALPLLALVALLHLVNPSHAQRAPAPAPSALGVGAPSGGPGSAASGGLPEAVLKAHYTYRQTLALRRCFLEGSSSTNCSDPDQWRLNEVLHLYPEEHLTVVGSDGVPQNCGGSSGGGSYGWVTSNLTSALNDLVEPLAQTLAAECELTKNCTDWQSTVANPESAIRSYLEAGKAAFVLWLSRNQESARLCPQPDTGGVVATVAGYPATDGNLLEVPQWAQALLLNGDLSVEQFGDLLKFDGIKTAFEPQYGLDRLEELSQLLIHFSLDTKTLEKLKLESSTSRRKLQAMEHKATRRLLQADVCEDVQNIADVYDVNSTACAQLTGSLGSVLTEVEAQSVGNGTLVSGQILSYLGMLSSYDLDPSKDVRSIAALTDVGTAVDQMLGVATAARSGTLSPVGIAGLACALPAIAAKFTGAAAVVCAPGFCTAGPCYEMANGNLGNWALFLLNNTSST